MRFAPNISLIALPDQYRLKIISCLLRDSYFEIQIRTPTLFLPFRTNCASMQLTVWRIASRTLKIVHTASALSLPEACTYIARATHLQHTGTFCILQNLCL